MGIFHQIKIVSLHAILNFLLISVQIQFSFQNRVFFLKGVNCFYKATNFFCLLWSHHQSPRQCKDETCRLDITWFNRPIKTSVCTIYNMTWNTFILWRRCLEKQSRSQPCPGPQPPQPQWLFHHGERSCFSTFFVVGSAKFVNWLW